MCYTEVILKILPTTTAWMLGIALEQEVPYYARLSCEQASIGFRVYSQTINNRETINNKL